MNEILFKMTSHKIEPKLIRLVQQRQNSEPKLFLVKGKRLGKSGLRCMPTLVMSDDYGATEELKRIYEPFFMENKLMKGK